MRIGLNSITVAFLLIYGCSTVPVCAQPVTVAVWDFDNVAMVAELDYLGKIFPEMLLTELASVPSIRLVERVHLSEVLEEQKLDASEIASDETRLRLGRIAGAQNMVFGSYFAIGDQVRVDMRLVEVETSLTRFAGQNTGSVKNIKSILTPLIEKLIAVFRRGK